MTTKKALKEQEKQEAVNTLLAILKPGDTVYTDVKHVSHSGMSRQVAVFVPYVDDGGKARIKEITWLVSKVLGVSVGSKYGIIMGGCGMDMCFEVVYRLGMVLWPNGTPEPHGRRNGEPDSCGGYALKKENL